MNQGSENDTLWITFWDAIHRSIPMTRAITGKEAGDLKKPAGEMSVLPRQTRVHQPKPGDCKDRSILDELFIRSIKMPKMVGKLSFLIILVTLIAQFTAVDTTLAGGSISQRRDSAFPVNNGETSGDIFALLHNHDFKWRSILVKPKPTSTLVIPTLPTRTPVTPTVPTSTPITPTLPAKTPTSTSSRVPSSTSTPFPPINTPARNNTFTPTLVYPTGAEAEIMDQTPTTNRSSSISTLMDTPQPSSPTAAQLVNTPITGTSITVQSENPQQGLPLVIILSVLMMGMIGIGGLVFGNLSFLGISHLD